jgi:hypothetical protein
MPRLSVIANSVLSNRRKSCIQPMSPVNTRREPTKPVIKKRPLTQTKSQNDFSIINVDLKLSKDK